MRTTQDPVPALPPNGSYAIGIDTGQNSVGLSAIALDEHDMPVEILTDQSVIHDGGVDPNARKSSESRKAASGLARRAKKRIKVARRRQNRLDKFLKQNGWYYSQTQAHPYQVWFDRARAATSFIEDQDERNRILGSSFKHIANHRGWRNPYQSVETLFYDDNYTHQPGYLSLKKKVKDQGVEVTDNLTMAQLIVAALQLPGPADGLDEDARAIWTEAGQLKIRSTKIGRTKEPALLTERQYQEDYAAEIRRICEVQRIPEETCQKLIKIIFYQKKSTAPRPKNDDLLNEPRASISHPEFQRYRIATTLSTLSIRIDNKERPLTVSERQAVYELLTKPFSTHEDAPEWYDVAAVLGVEVSNIKGIASPTGDPTMLVGHHPPYDSITEKILSGKSTPLKKWWKKADFAARCNFIETKVDHSEPDEEVTEFLLSLTTKQLITLEKVDIPAGRAAYSVKACRLLADELLSTEKDLHTARKDVFNLPDDWRPAQEPIGSPTGNPAVDRTLKEASRFLLMCRKYWGEPARITVEVARKGLVSAKVAQEMSNNQRNAWIRQQRREREGAGVLPNKSSRSAHKKYEMISRQGGKCLYCGSPISMETCENEHIIPRSGPGSSNRQTNIVAACHRCNQAKGNRTFKSWVKEDRPSYTSLKKVKDFVNNELVLSD